MGLRSATGRAAIGSSCSSSQFAFCVVVSAWPCATCLSMYSLATSPKVLAALNTAISFSCLRSRSEEHTLTPVTNAHLVCRLLLEKKKHTHTYKSSTHEYNTTITYHYSEHILS